MGKETKLIELFETAAAKGASDLHLIVDRPPILRIDGVLTELKGQKVLDGKYLQDIIYAILTEAQKERLERTRELDFSFDVLKNRMRVNVHWTEGDIGLVARVIPIKVPSMGEIGLGEVEYQLTHLYQGLVLVTGPAGCGKSTTLASMINQINLERNCHIVTLEDPIEFDFKHGRSIVRQREIGADTLSFAGALKHILRQDPNVILVGEMRDLETIASTITLAETGHLVFSTLHTPSAAQTIDRIIDIFPPYQQHQVRLQVANTLRAIISQRLLPAIGGGRVAAREILINTPAVANLIRENEIAQIQSVIQTGKKLGMKTMNQAVQELYEKGVIEKELARHRIEDPYTLSTYY